jgi:hypothetical protein
MKPTKPLYSLTALTLLSCSSFTFAFDDPASQYSTDSQDFNVWNQALEPVELVNSILCFTSQMKATEFVNEGPYISLVDEGACFDNEGGNTGQSTAASNTPTYMEVVVNATRESDTEPLIVSVWIPGMEAGEDEQAIKFKAVVTEGASEDDPFGQFTFNFDFYDNFDSATPAGGGEVKTIDSVAGKIGFTLYESAERDGFDTSQSASVVMSEDKTEGIALTASSFGAIGEAYGLAFNQNNVLVQTGDDYDDLGFQTGDSSGSCLNRTEFTEAVWRYDLYDVESGDRVEVDSGMSFRFDSDNDGDNDSYGHIGYWGIWTEEQSALANGDTITAEDFSTGEGEEFTVIKAPGRLIKLTVESLSLADARGIDFYYWDDTAFEQDFESWVVNYLTAENDEASADGFYKVAGVRWGEQGSQRTDVTPELISVPNNETLHMRSDQLGGGVKYKQGDTELSFYQESFVNGSESATGELFADGAAALHCVERCPVGTLGTTELASFDSPYVQSINSVDDAVAYSINPTGANAMTLVRTSNSETVRYEDGLTENSLQQSPNAWGVRSGAMVSADVLASLSNPWDIYDPEIVSTFYVWETGLNEWNQLATVRDANGAIRTFDKPIQFTYKHSDANDRTADAGENDGMTVMLSYGGNGDLWGIPHEQTDDHRGYPLFNIADGVAMGPNNSYVVKAREIEGTMADATGQCTDMTITEPEVAVPTSVTGSADIGDMPTVTASPAVIAGVVQSSEQ